MELADRYPTELIDRWTLADGRRVTVRPVLPQDAELEQALVRGLSREARYARFMTPLRELTPQWLERLTRIDYRRHLALVAESFDAGGERVVGEARYVIDSDDDGAGSADFALLTAEDWRRTGLGTRLLDRLAAHARRVGLAQLHGDVLHDNRAMLALARRQGFRVLRHPDDARLLRVRLDLRCGARAAEPAAADCAAAY